MSGFSPRFIQDAPGPFTPGTLIQFIQDVLKVYPPGTPQEHRDAVSTPDLVIGFHIVVGVGVADSVGVSLGVLYVVTGLDRTVRICIRDEVGGQSFYLLCTGSCCSQFRNT